MNIRLMPINDDNRDAVLSLSVREDQPFVAPNDVSLRQADEANAEQPGVARPFAIYADEKLALTPKKRMRMTATGSGAL